MPRIGGAALLAAVMMLSVAGPAAATSTKDILNQYFALRTAETLEQYFALLQGEALADLRPEPQSPH